MVKFNKHCRSNMLFCFIYKTCHFCLYSWSYNTRTKVVLSVSKTSILYLMTTIDFTNYQNTMHVWSYLKLDLHITH